MLSPTLAVTTDGEDIGELGSWVRLRARQTLNRVSGWTLKAPIDARFVESLLPTTPTRRSGFILSDPAHKSVLTGFVTRRSVIDGAVVELSGKDDLGILAQRQVYPDPTQPGPPFAVSHWTHSAPPVDAIAQLINVNCGPGAHASRRMPEITIVADPDPNNPTGNIDLRGRLDRVSDLIAERGGPTGVAVTVLCDGNGGYIITIRQSRYLEDVVFDDTSAAKRRRTQLGTEANVVLAGGAGEGADRLFVQSEDGAPTGLGRFEEFIDKRGVSDAGELGSAATEELSTGAASRSLDITLADAGSHVFGKDLQLGDFIWLVTDGEEGFVRVTGSDLTVDERGEKRTLTIGPALPAGTSTRSKVSRRLLQLERGD